MHWNEGPVPVSMLTGRAPATDVARSGVYACISIKVANSAHHTVAVAMHMCTPTKQKHYEHTYVGIHSSTLRGTSCSERCQQCTLPLSEVLEGPCIDIIEDDVARKACWGASLSPIAMHIGHQCASMHN